MKIDHLSKELQEFILSFNTTMCFALAFMLFFYMRKETNIIDEESIDEFCDSAFKFIPKPVINLLDKLHGCEETNEEFSPV